MMGGNLSAQSMGLQSDIVSLLLSAFVSRFGYISCLSYSDMHRQVVRFIFKRWEPQNLPLNTALPFGIPRVFSASLDTPSRTSIHRALVQPVLLRLRCTAYRHSCPSLGIPIRVSRSSQSSGWCTDYREKAPWDLHAICTTDTATLSE